MVGRHLARLFSDLAENISFPEGAPASSARQRRPALPRYFARRPDRAVAHIVQPYARGQALIGDGCILNTGPDADVQRIEDLRDPTGVTSLMPPQTKVVGPVVEAVFQRLAHGQGTASQLLTDLTLLSQADRRAGRDEVRTKAKKSAPSITVRAPSVCGTRGVLLEQSGRHYCDDCLLEQVASFSAGGWANLAELQAARNDSRV